MREARVGWMVSVELGAVAMGRLHRLWVSARCLVGGLGSSVPCRWQPSLLSTPAPTCMLGSDPGLTDSDSEESVFSGLEESGSDSTEDDSASEEEGAGTSKQRSRMDRSPGQQVGEPGVSQGLPTPQTTTAKIAPAGHHAP